MMGIWQSFLDWLLGLFFLKEMEITLVGLQNAGKSTLVNVLATGAYRENLQPTVGFNMLKVKKGRVTIKMWDLGGQPRFRTMWERYCRGVHAVVFVVDAADAGALEAAKAELYDLLARPSLAGVPVLVVGNKADLPTALGVEGLIGALGLRALTGRELCCYAVSCKKGANIDAVVQWLTAHAGPTPAP